MRPYFDDAKQIFNFQSQNKKWQNKVRTIWIGSSLYTCRAIQIDRIECNIFSSTCDWARKRQFIFVANRNKLSSTVWRSLETRFVEKVKLILIWIWFSTDVTEWNFMRMKWNLSRRTSERKAKRKFSSLSLSVVVSCRVDDFHQWQFRSKSMCNNQSNRQAKSLAFFLSLFSHFRFFFLFFCCFSLVFLSWNRLYVIGAVLLHSKYAQVFVNLAQCVVSISPTAFEWN